MRTLITGASSGLGEGMARELAASRARPRARRPAPRPSRGPARRARAHRASGSPSPRSTSTTTTRSSRRSGRCATSSAGSTAWSSTRGGQGRADRHRTLRRQPGHGAHQLRRRARAVRGGHGDLPRAERRVTSSWSRRWPPTAGSRAPRRRTRRRRRRLSHLAEGIRVDVADTPIRVTTLAPGYIRTDLNEGMSMPLSVDAATGSRAMVEAIEKRACLRLRADLALGGRSGGCCG